MSEAATPDVLDADEYLADSFRLARRIWDAGCRPDYLVALWRGGAPPGIAIQEYFRWRGEDFTHTAIRTQSLEGVRAGGGFDIRGFEQIVDVIEADECLLIVDNFIDTGRTVSEVVTHLRDRARRNTPRIEVAAVYFRPSRHCHPVGPDHWLHEVEHAPVFPHELRAMDPELVRERYPDLHASIWDPVTS